MRRNPDGMDAGRRGIKINPTILEGTVRLDALNKIIAKILFKQKHRLIESIIKNYDICINCDDMIYPFELITIYIIVGVMEIILGLPLLFEKIKPNWFYGFRLPKSMSNKEIWYKTNRYVGRDFIVAGIIVIIAALVVLMFQINFDIISSSESRFKTLVS